MKHISLTSLFLGFMLLSGTIKAQDAAWINFGDVVNNFNGGSSALWSTPLFPDDGIILDENDGDPLYPYSHHIATVTNPSDVNYSFIDETQSCFIDSVSIAYLYEQSLFGVVDTLLVNVIAHSDDLGAIALPDESVVQFQHVYYDYITNGISGDQILATYKVPLNAEMVTEPGLFDYIDIFTDGLVVAPGERVGATVTFIPGYDYNSSDLLADKNTFSYISFEQNGAGTTPDFLGLNANNSYVVNGEVLNNTSTNGWNGEMIPTVAFPQPAYATEDHLIYFYVTTDGDFCTTENLLTEVSGNITDGSQTANYGNNADCDWTIDVENAELIYFNFNNFNLTDGDLLNIYSGTDDSGELIFSLSGEIADDSFGVMSGGQAFLNFTSDDALTSTGFDINYTAYTANESAYCDDNIYNASAGVIVDGSDDNDYQNNTFCTHHIDIPDATQIVINFSYIDLQEGDHILIFADESMDVLLTEITADVLDTDLALDANEMFIVFVTDNNLNAGGWYMDYSSDAPVSPLLVENIEVVPLACNEEFTTVNFDISGGTPPYFFSNEDEYSIYELPEGTHDFVFTDSADGVFPITVTVDPGPTFDVSISEEDDVLTATMASTYQWAYNDVDIEDATNQTLAVSVSGNYTVYVSNEDDCDASFSYFYSTDGEVSCTSGNILTEISGNINDGSGLADYINNANCDWTVDVENAELIYLNFNNFNLTDGDLLNIYSGTDDSGELIFSLTGEIPDDSFGVMTGGQAFFNFTSDGTLTNAGFDIDYTAYTTNESAYCDDNVYNASAGVIVDGSGDNNYQNNTFCTHHIDIPDATQIIINFSYIDLQEGDHILIYTDESMDVLLTEITIDVLDTELSLDANEMFIVFATDNSLTAGGWYMDYSSDAPVSPLLVDNIQVVPLTCNEEFTTVDFEISGGTPPYFFSNEDEYSIYELPEGTHDFVFTDSADGVFPITVTVDPGPTFDVSISEEDGVLTATMGSTYQWAYNGVDIDDATNQTLVVSFAGEYTVYVNDGAGCEGSFTYVYETEDITVNNIETTAEDCVTGFGSFTYSVSGGVPPYEISNEDGYTPDELPQGGHEFIITDAALTEYNFTVNIPGSPLFSVNISLSGEDLMATSGVSYQWSFEEEDIEGATAQTYTPTESGTYAVIVTNEEGCTGADTYEFTIIIDPISVEVTNVNDADCSDGMGSFTYNVSGGVPTYEISNEDGYTPDNVPAGTHEFVITDAEETNHSFTVTIGEQPTLDVAISFVGGELIADPTATTYQWSLDGEEIEGATAQAYIPTENGVYSVVTTNEDGCTGTDSYDYEAAYTITVNVTNIQHPACDETTGSFEYSVEGGAAPFVENFGAINADEVPPGTHLLSITDANGVSAEFSVTINEAEVLDVVLDYNDMELSINTTVSVVDYEWTFNGNPIEDADGANYTPTENGLYGVTISNAEGCEASDEYNVTNLSIDDLALEISLYPNPAQDWIVLDLPDHFVENTTIRISDINGKHIKNVVVEAVSTRIDLRGLARGNYIIECQHKGIRTYKKFVIN